MSQTIDSRVVQMQFDNKQFESGAAQSMGTLKNLDKALNGVDGAKAFANISRAAGNVDLSGVINGVSALQDRFSVMGTFVHNTLLGIVESAANAGKQIANALVFNPAKTGFAEYELQLNSTQRILANTKSKGEDIKSVNAALDQLNEYADLTIYNFSQMTDNIGRFTAAGVGLDDSVLAIKGLSNAAALFGADSNAAARAGYQLSQALAAGTIKLMDWNSLVNSSMGGEQMQNAIMRVARHHGVAIDAMIEKEGSFRETLSQGWLTSDIMLEALSHFTTANDEASKAALRAKGYTEEEIAAIVELGETATESATVVKTASQLFNTLGEELGSAWAQTWRSIMGDYEEAKTTFSAIHEELSGIVGAWADAQTALVEGWAELGGRTDLFDSVFNVFNALKSVLGPIGQAFADVFPPITAQRLADLTRKLKEFTQGLILNEDQMARLKSVATSVFSGIKTGLTTVTNIAKSLGRVVSTVVTGFAKGLASTISYIGKINVAYKPISEWINLGIKGVVNFANAIPNFVNNVLDMAQAGTLFENVYNRMPKTIQHVMGIFQNSFKDLQGRIWGIKQGILQTKTLTEAYSQIMLSMPLPIQKVMGTIQNGYLKIANTFKFIRSEAIKNKSVLAGINAWIATLGPAWQTLLTPIADFFGKVQIKLMQFREVLLNATTPMEIFAGMLTLLPQPVQQLISRFNDFSKVLGITLTDSFKSLTSAFSDFFNVVIPNFGDFFASLRENSVLLKDDFVNFFTGVGDAFKAFISSTPTSFAELKQNFSKLKDDIISEFMTLRDAVKSFFSAMGNEDGESMLPKIGSRGFKSVVVAFEKLQTDVREIFDKGWSNLKPHLETMWGQLPEVLGDKAMAAIDKIGEIFNTADLGNKLKESLTKALSGVEGVLSRIFDGILSATGLSVKNSLSRIKDTFISSFKGLGQSAGDSAKKTGKSITQRLKSGLDEMPEVIESTKSKVVEKTKVMTAHIGRAMRPMLLNTKENLLQLKDNTESLLVHTFDKAVDDLSTILPKMVSTVTTGLGALPEVLSKAGKGIRTAFTTINTFLGKIPFKEIFSEIGDGLKGLYESVTGLEFTSLTDSLKKGFDWLINGGAKQIIGAILALDIHGLISKWNKDAKSLGDVFKAVGDSFKELKKIFTNASKISGNINKSLKSIANKNNAEALKDVAKAVAIFAASIWLLSSIPWENMKVGLAGFAAAVTVAVGAFVAFSKVSQSMANNSKSWSLTRKGLRFEAADNANMMAMASAMVAFAAAVGILSLSLAKLGSLSGGGAVQGLIALTTIVTLIVGSMKMLTEMDAVNVGKVVVPLLALTAVVKILSGIVEDLAALKPGPAAVALGGVSAMMIALSASLTLMGNAKKLSLKAVVGLAAIVLVLRGLEPVIAELSKLNPTSVLGVCGGVALLLGALGLVISALSPSKFKVNLLSGNKLFGPLASMALLIGSIGLVILALSKIKNTTAAMMSATAIAVLLVVVGAILHHINSLENIKPAAALTIAAMGVFITLFGNAVIKMALVASLNPIAATTAFIAAVSALAVAAGAINRVPEIRNVGAAVTMVALGAFISMFATAVSIMATLTALNPIGAIISTTACCVALGILLRQINNLPDIKGMGASASILALGIALNGLAKALVTLSGLSVGGMLTGLVGVGGILMELSLAIKTFGDNDAGIAGLRKAGMAFLVISVGMTALSKANPLYLIANLAALGVALFAFSKGAAALAPALPVMTHAAVALLAFSAAAVIFSGAVALFGVGLQAVAIGLVALVTSVVTNIGLITAAFTGLLHAFIALQPVIAQAILSVIQTISTVLVTGAPQIAQALGQLFLSLLDEVIVLLPQILTRLMDSFIENMNLITEYAPRIAEAFTNMFVAAVDAMTPKIPVIVAKLGELLHVILDELVNMLKDLATLNVEQIGAAIMGIIGVAALMGKFSGIFKAAVKGIGQLAVLIAEIGVVIVAFGAISKIPGVKDLVASGGDLLGQIGYAIGNFVGSIIGGFGAGATSGLPAIAANLSAFAVGIRPFISTMKSGGGDLVSAVGDVAAAMLLLTGADLLSGIMKFLGAGGSSLVEFGNQLNAFAVPFRSFCDKLQGIDVAAVSGGAQAAKALAEMMKILSTSGGGGLKGLILGDAVNLDDFGQQIQKLGDCLRTASTAFQGVDSAAILAAIPAAQALTDLAKDMPRKGGVIDAIAGEQVDLDVFGEQVVAFGEALVIASTAFTNVDSAAIQAAIPAAQALADLAKDMPRKGGLIDTIAGEQIDLPTFGVQVGAFGAALAAASKIMDGVDSDAILSAIEPAQALAQLAESMVKTGGFVQKITGENMDLATFGADVESFGASMKSFGESLGGISEDIGSKTDTVVGAMESLGSLKEKVPDLANLREGVNRIAGMKDSFVSFGESIVALSTSLVGLDATVIQNAQTATECIKAIATSIPPQAEIDAIPDLSGLQTKFSSMAESIKVFGEAVDQIDPSQISGAAQAFDEIITLVNRINSINVSSFSGLADAFKNAAQNAVDGFKSTLESANVSGTVDSFFAAAKNSALANGSALTTGFVKPVEDAITGIGNLSPRFSEVGAELGKSIGSGASESRSSITSAFSTLVTSANASLSGKKQLFYNTGANLVQGLINGINSKKQAAIQAGTALGNAVSQATRNATQVKSPSRVFFKIGDYLVQGLALGINQNGVKAVKASRALANSTIMAMQEELKINSPSKVAKDEVGNWIVEGIAEGIESNMSAEEAAAKKAENIINAFQTALDKIDLEFTTRDLDHKIAELLDVTGANLRGIKEAESRDAMEKAAKTYELKKGAYDTIVKEGLTDTDEGIKALNEMKQAYADYLQAMQDYRDYVLSNEDKYSVADKIAENQKKELEIWKKQNPYATDAEIAKKEDELTQKNLDLAKDKASNAYAHWQAALQIYGESAKQTVDAYSAYLDIKNEIADLLKVDTNQNEETAKTFEDHLREWAAYWNESGQQLLEMGWTQEQIAEGWFKTTGYNPLTGEINNGKTSLQSIDNAVKESEALGQQKIAEYVKMLTQGGDMVAQGITTMADTVGQAIQTVGQSYVAGMKDAGTAGVNGLVDATLAGTQALANAGNQIVSVVPNQVIPSVTSEWRQAGLDLIQAMIDGLNSGQGALIVAISEVIQKALSAAMVGSGLLGGKVVSGVQAAPQSSRSDASGGSKYDFFASKKLNDKAETTIDEATQKWLDEHPEYVGTINFFWTFDAAKQQGRLKDWARDEYGNIVKVGESIGDGIAEGVSNSTDTVQKATDTMIEVVPETVASNLDINSPSHVMEAFGRYIDMGLANGIVDNKKLVGNAAVTMLEAVSTEVEESKNIPEVTPVIDFSKLKREVNMANRMLGRVSFDRLADVAGTIQNASPSNQNQLVTSEVVNNYDFTQNNYSPKALSNATIYRQTKNQFAVFARKKG